MATAVLPFFIVMGARMVWGKGRTMSWLIMLSTVWFVANILLAPYSARMRQDILTLMARVL